MTLEIDERSFDSRLIECVSAEDAYARRTANPYSRWPSRGKDDQRLSPVAKPFFRPSFRISPEDAVFTIGSCFARNIEAYLKVLGFVLPALEFRTDAFSTRRNLLYEHNQYSLLNKYNPFAMLNEFRWAMGIGPVFDPDTHLFELRSGYWIDPQSHGHDGFSLPQVVARRRAINAIFARVAQCGVVIITLGLVEAWFDKVAGLYLNWALPPKIISRHPGRFELHVLDSATIRASLVDLIGLLRSACPPDLRIVLTVSPVPLDSTFRDMDVLTANMYSKSVLRAVAEEIWQRYSFVDYFPSYESVMLTGNAVAFVDDLRHVTDAVVGQIVSTMIAGYITPDASQNADLLFRKAEAFARQANYGEAISTYEQARAMAPERSDILRGLGEAYRQEKSFDRAKDCFTEAARLEPRDATSLYLLALVERQRGDRNSAFHWLGVSLAIDDRNAGAHAVLATMLLEDARLKEALAAIDTAVKLVADRDGFWYTKCRILMGLERHEDAAEALKTAIKLVGTKPVFFHVMALIEHKLNRLDRARIAAETAVRLAPENAAFRGRLEMLQSLSG